MGLRAPLFVAFLLLVPAALFVTPEADACGVPCGRIYPIILIKLDDPQPQYPMSQGTDLVLPGTLTYKFNVAENGYTVEQPNQDIVVTFEYPRKPVWVDLSVDPPVVDIDVNSPFGLKPDATNPQSPSAEFEFTVPITITARLNGQQPVLRDGYDFQKLLVFAKSTESGLYQSGYGIKEVRVVPEGALHESDVAGSRDVFTATPVQSVALAGGESSFQGTTFALETPPKTDLWQPTDLTFAIDPPAARALVSVHEESGALVALRGPLDASSGAVTLPTTFVHPGRHVATVTLFDSPAGAREGLTLTVPFDVGDLAPEGFAYPKSMLVRASETFPTPALHAADPLVTFERDTPFFAYDSAQSTVASITISTPGASAAGAGVANLQFLIIDPEGKPLQSKTVDPQNPTGPIRIGSLPGDGWYTLRVRGSGAFTAAQYDVRIEVTYPSPHEARNRADGVGDVTGGRQMAGTRNLTLPVDALAAWSAAPFTPVLETVDAAAYSLTVFDDAGALVYASGQRVGEATFVPPAQGLYLATVSVVPGPADVFAPTTRAFGFRVGDGATTVAQSFAIDDVLDLPAGAAQEAFVGAWRIPVPADVAESSLEVAAPAGASMRFTLIDRDGSETPVTDTLSLDAAKGPYLLVAHATNAGPAQSASLNAVTTFAQPVTLEDEPATQETPKARIPGLAIGIGLATVGFLAVAVALVRRR